MGFNPDMWVGFYVSHPGQVKDSNNILEVKFSEFTVQTVAGAWPPE